MNALRDDRVATRIAVVAVGIAAFLAFVGPLALLPSNIAWLSRGDPAQHFLGWQFFRTSPWTFPLGLNPSLGLELSNGIAYSDSIPGLALVFKALSPILPPVFQYFGWWLLACFILQAWFGWKLAGLVTTRRWVRVLIAALFATAPPLLMRAPHHIALSGHFLILAAIYLVLRPGRRHQATLWLLLLVAAALTSAYLMMMAGACWLADLAADAARRKKPWRLLAIEAGATIAAVLLALWQAGFFVESDKGAAGFGLYRFNLLSLIDPNGWSYVLPDLPGGPGDYEGFNFLGAGLLMLALVAVGALLAGRLAFGRIARRLPFFLLVLVAFTLFAMSNHVGIGPLDLTVPLPQGVLDGASIFRASGRVFWPVFYVLMLTIVYLVVRGTLLRVAAPLLALALVVQVVDTSGAWRGGRSRMMEAPAATWSTPLTSHFWDVAGDRYRELRRVLPENTPPLWDRLGYFAVTQGMGTDIVYLPRISQTRLLGARQVATEAMDTGRYRADALYIVAPEYLPRVAASIDPAIDLLAEVDGQYVVAPGWVTCGTCPAVDALGIDAFAPSAVVGQTVGFGLPYPTVAHLLSGWSLPEPWGVWSLGTESRLLFAAPEGLSAISLVVDAFTPNAGMAQRLVASVNGHEALRTSVRGGGSAVDIPIGDEIRRAVATERRLVITFSLPDAVSPAAAGVSPDPREIAIGLHSVTFR